jgi:hypothetical protein
MGVRQALLAATSFVLFVLFVSKLVGVGRAEILAVGGFILSVAQYFREGKTPEKTGTAPGARARKTRGPPRTFRARLDDGLFGGLTGGCLAGVIIGFAYHYAAEPPGASLLVIIPHIILASAVTGVVLGVLAQLFSSWFAHLSSESGQSALVFNEFTGGLLGGLLTGGLMGAALGWYFGPRPEPLLAPIMLLAGAVPGTIVILSIMMAYDARKLSRAFARNVLVALVTGAVVAFAGLAAAEVSGLPGVIQNYFFYGDRGDHVLGGAIFGLFAGAVLGAVLGVNLLLRRVWAA